MQKQWLLNCTNYGFENEYGWSFSWKYVHSLLPLQNMDKMVATVTKASQYHEIS